MKQPNGYGSVTKLSGKRRRPWIVKKTSGFDLNEKTGKVTQKYIIIGYAATKKEGLDMLADYNRNPYDLIAAKMTFEEVFDEYKKEKFPTISENNQNGYIAAFKACEDIHDLIFKDLRLKDLQDIIDTCGKNFPTLKKIKTLFNQMYKFAMKNDICNKDYAQFVNVIKYKNKNPDKLLRDKFTNEEIKTVYDLSKDHKWYSIVLMLLFNGCRISEFLNLKKENINIEKQYFDIIKSKTENGIRRVPIGDGLVPYYKAWLNDGIESEYLLHTDTGAVLDYRNYYDSYWKPLMDQINCNKTPHCARHTCVSMLKETEIPETNIKKIVGHSGSMTLTERVYTHLDITILIDAINKIYFEYTQK